MTFKSEIYTRSDYDDKKPDLLTENEKHLLNNACGRFHINKKKKNIDKKCGTASEL